MGERACLSDHERRFNRAERYVDHDQRETVPILVRPRDNDDDGDGDDHGDSGTVSGRAECLSLTFAAPMMDRCRGGPPQRHSIRSNITRGLNPNILVTPIWSNERSSELLETRERRSPSTDGDGNASMEVTTEDFGASAFERLYDPSM